jgi:hypothetical protein
MKKIETSKLLLWGGNIFGIVFAVIIVKGWFMGLMDAYQFFLGDMALLGVLDGGYYLKAGFENCSKKDSEKMKQGMEKLVATAASAMTAGSIPGAVSQIANMALQKVELQEQMQQSENYNNQQPQETDETQPLDEEK